MRNVAVVHAKNATVLIIYTYENKYCCQSNLSFLYGRSCLKVRPISDIYDHNNSGNYDNADGDIVQRTPLSKPKTSHFKFKKSLRSSLRYRKVFSGMVT